MNEKHIQQISKECQISLNQVKETAILLSEGATIPFIARYRKERTGQLDEVAITKIRDGLQKLKELDDRKEAIFKSLIERDILTDELRDAIHKADSLTVLEDIYLPFRPKKRTKATIAKEKGLEPLAQQLWEQNVSVKPEVEAEKYLNQESVPSVEDALSGARDIMAEWINEDSVARKEIRALFEKEGIIASKVRKNKENAGQKYLDYFEWEEPVASAPSHRLLAIFRGEKEEILSLKIRPSEEKAVSMLEAQFLKNNSPSAEQIKLSVEDAYKRLTSVSMETEIRNQLKEKADLEAIRVFAGNLRELLMAPPLGQKPILAMDPGYRTGCKVVCLDPQGKLLKNVTVFITSSKAEAENAKKTIMGLFEQYHFEAVAIGNGTASRETEAFVKALPLPPKFPVIMVNESGASIYSASEVARKEFADYDVTVRGAVSIGRRLMDPLAELVKIDPKSIGVGQYQHDVDQSKLKTSLDDTVVSCVNQVGVELNTASEQLLSYVSGLGASLAKNILEFRDKNGAFENRVALKKVPRLGPKAFEQAAGFLRIANGKHPLDASAVHPERYSLVEKMAADQGCSVSDLMQSPELRDKIKLNQYVNEEVGLPTLRDIIDELAKPGRDPREPFEVFAFDEEVKTIEDLKPGMKLPGIVTNVTNFGAFVDVGVHQDGLVHISQLSDRFVKNPETVVKVHQKVSVTVMEVDIARKRIALSMKTDPFQEKPAPAKKPQQSQQSRKEKTPPKQKKEFGYSPFADLFGS